MDLPFFEQTTIEVGFDVIEINLVFVKKKLGPKQFWLKKVHVKKKLDPRSCGQKKNVVQEIKVKKSLSQKMLGLKYPKLTKLELSLA